MSNSKVFSVRLQTVLLTIPLVELLDNCSINREISCIFFFFLEYSQSYSLLLFLSNYFYCQTEMETICYCSGISYISKLYQKAVEYTGFVSGKMSLNPLCHSLSLDFLFCNINIIFYQANLLFRIKRHIKSFPDKKKLREFIITKPVLQEMIGLL